MRKYFYAPIMMLSLILISCDSSVKIGDQTWMTENLDVSTFRNGDPIPEAKTDEEWEKAYENGQPAWCYYDNDPANGVKYGRLYNWYAVNDSRGLAPKGWHVPSVEEWIVLINHLGGEDLAGSRMKNTSGWHAPNVDRDGNGNGNNESGFSGLPGGSLYWLTGFGNVGSVGSWWSSSHLKRQGMVDKLYECHLGSNYDNAYIGTAFNRSGLSVRCIKDE